VKTVALPSGEQVPVFGLGTWNMGDGKATRAEEIATLRMGLDAGATLIDTAEMYGDGRSEELVGEAIAGRRDGVFLVTKVYPHNASKKGVPTACERSLQRLGTDRIDLYLLHWRGSVPFAETIGAFEALKKAGKVRHYGVSNLDLSDMKEWWKLKDGANCAASQLLYNLTRRGIEFDLLPWLRERKVPVMAYSPIEQARLARDRRLGDFAKKHGMTAAQAALAWLLSKEGVIVIPKTGRRERLKENLGALDKKLDAAQLAELDRLFPPPSEAESLAML
jgi:diketogulonate reductase-like aldo/keto reductase